MKNFQKLDQKLKCAKNYNNWLRTWLNTSSLNSEIDGSVSHT